MNQNLIPEEDLLAWTGYKQRADLTKWLKSKNIDFQLGKGGRICTTNFNINQHEPKPKEIRLVKSDAA